jgi:hypothetical protein
MLDDKNAWNPLQVGYLGHGAPERFAARLVSDSPP